MTLATLGGVTLQVVAFFVIGLASGELLLRWSGLLPGERRDGPQVVWAGIVERLLGAIVGFVAFAVGAMILNIVTGGLVFGVPGIVSVAAAGVVWLWWRRRLMLPRPRAISLLWAAVLAVALLAVFATPMVASGSSVRSGDPPWHLGWTEQLLAGERVPLGPAPEFARNAYPWGLHATMATLVRVVPGTEPLLALDALHLVILAGIPLAAAALALRVRRDAGWAAAACATLIGGLGWVVAGGPDFVTSPSSARYGADLVVASPNSVYELFPPALPRELGVVLVGAAGVFAMIAARSRIRRVELLAGATAGLAGLISVPMFIGAVIWMICIGLVVEGDRARFLKHTVGGAALVFGLWALPVAIDHVRFSGFVDITPRLGKEWPLYVALASWGLLLPLAGAGAVLLARKRSIEERALLAVLAGTAVLLTLSILRGAFDWDLWGNATLLHQGRVWPLLHLAAAVPAGVAVCILLDRFRRPALRAAVTVVLLGVGAASPVLASIHLSDVMKRGAAGFAYGQTDVRADDGFLRRAADALGPQDVVLVEGSDELAFLLFQLSGVRLADYDHPDLERNDLRIRFADLARRWEERMAAGGFPPDFTVVEGSHADAVASGTFDDRRWSLLAKERP